MVQWTSFNVLGARIQEEGRRDRSHAYLGRTHDFIAKIMCIVVGTLLYIALRSFFLQSSVKMRTIVNASRVRNKANIYHLRNY